MNQKEINLVRYLLKDALHEFCSAREPIHDYVEKRYSENSAAFKASKRLSVGDRVDKAHWLLENMDQLLQGLNGEALPAGQYWLVYSEMNGCRFAHCREGSFLEVAVSCGDTYFPLTEEEYNNFVEDLEWPPDADASVKMVATEKLIKRLIAYVDNVIDNDGDGYKVVEWCKHPKVENLGRREPNDA